MRNKTLLLVALLGSLFLYSCGDDLIERDLDRQKVNMLFPSNNHVSSGLSITFMWEEVKGATEYNLQVVRPSFSNLNDFLLDTNVTDTRFTFSFQPGHTYQWRVKAKNGSSATAYVVSTFSIDSSLSLANQAVQLLTPVEGLNSKDSNQSFTWGPMALANDFRFEIINSLGTIVYKQAAITETKASYKFLSEGVYKWRVQAHNDNGSVSLFASRNITIDFTAPEASQADAPADNASVSNPVNLSWTKAAGSYKDSLFISSDSLFTSILDKKLIESNTYNFTGNSGTTYFWRLKTNDLAGNWSTYSQTYKFKVN